jgi:hypothetical protein
MLFHIPTTRWLENRVGVFLRSRFYFLKYAIKTLNKHHINIYKLISQLKNDKKKLNDFFLSL